MHPYYFRVIGLTFVFWGVISKAGPLENLNAFTNIRACFQRQFPYKKNNENDWLGMKSIVMTGRDRKIEEGRVNDAIGICRNGDAVSSKIFWTDGGRYPAHKDLIHQMEMACIRKNSELFSSFIPDSA